MVCLSVLWRLSQYLPPYLGFSYLGRGVAPLGCSCTVAATTPASCGHCVVWPPDGENQNQIDYILYSQGWKSSVQSAKTRPGVDCGSIHELLTAKFILKLKRVGETTRPFRYALNQIPYDYTVEVRNIFKGLDLIDRLPDELWMEVHDIVQETGIKTIQKEKHTHTHTHTHTHKWLSEEALQIAVKRRKKQWENERYSHLNAEFQRIPRRDKKAFLSHQCNEIEENNRMGKSRRLYKKIRDTKGIFHGKIGSIKTRNVMDLTEVEDIKKR